MNNEIINEMNRHHLKPLTCNLEYKSLAKIKSQCVRNFRTRVWMRNAKKLIFQECLSKINCDSMTVKHKSDVRGNKVMQRL